MTAKLAFIAAHGSTSSIRRLCAVLGVARSWFQDWQASDQTRSSESRAEADLVDQIRGVFQHSGQRYGAPRIHAELQANGVRIARKREQRIRCSAPEGKRPSAAPAPDAAADHDRQPARRRHRPEPAPARLRSRSAEYDLAGGYYIRGHGRGLAVPGGCQGHGHPRDRRLEHGRPSEAFLVRKGGLMYQSPPTPACQALAA
jgi:hypothetical protein